LRNELGRKFPETQEEFEIEMQRRVTEEELLFYRKKLLEEQNVPVPRKGYVRFG
jgi:hypothetical protein